jgi:hypothetical protein
LVAEESIKRNKFAERAKKKKELNGKDKRKKN